MPASKSALRNAAQRNNCWPFSPVNSFRLEILKQIGRVVAIGGRTAQMDSGAQTFFMASLNW